MTIRDLLAAVEAGKEPSTREWEDALWVDLPSNLGRDLGRAFRGKLGAAVKVAQAFLPDYRWTVQGGGEKPRPGAVASLRLGDLRTSYRGEHQKPARALLIAILRALAEMEEG